LTAAAMKDNIILEKVVFTKKPKGAGDDYQT